MFPGTICEIHCEKWVGVILDSDFKLDKQINTVVKSNFFQLRLLSKIKSFLSFGDFERVIHAIISTQPDYCNALYVGVSQASLSRLQLVQNAAARQLTGTHKQEHISPVLVSLHWLPVRFRIDFKILLFAYKSLNGLPPTFLSDLLQPHVSARSLRSADQLLLVPRSRSTHRGDRAFAVIAPKLWNELPLHVTLTPTLPVLKTRFTRHF